MRTPIFTLATAILLGLSAPSSPRAETTLRVVPHSDLQILDPVWTTAYITRNHGYLIYETLLAVDDKGEIRPQMVEKYEASADGLTYTFTLRDGLLWHDGLPVTSEDCAASIRRWAAKYASGQMLMSITERLGNHGCQILQAEAEGSDRIGSRGA